MSNPKVRCRACGDMYSVEQGQEYPTPEAQICDECFDMQESSQGMPDNDYSDADSGL